MQNIIILFKPNDGLYRRGTRRPTVKEQRIDEFSGNIVPSIDVNRSTSFYSQKICL